jgi:hypothetical protein
MLKEMALLSKTDPRILITKDCTEDQSAAKPQPQRKPCWRGSGVHNQHLALRMLIVYTRPFASARQRNHDLANLSIRLHIAMSSYVFIQAKEETVDLC